eukprot:CAMPEP_0196801686 /NCGR_PEP_ID=MMETSP1362-20130617/1460_1 /TAXON_ID=163516 /ORGANISM="Leptocylindrus danicus, Strain CCMP1856" /LENGTH=225 /DNA_ID=CAMNT_0042172763 /DNA_START=152 /DNA_END=828 /DNA_ORIENTATION=+
MPQTRKKSTSAKKPRASGKNTSKPNAKKPAKRNTVSKTTNKTTKKAKGKESITKAKKDTTVPSAAITEVAEVLTSLRNVDEHLELEDEGLVNVTKTIDLIDSSDNESLANIGETSYNSDGDSFEQDAAAVFGFEIDIIEIKKNSNKPPICLSQFDFHMIKHERSNSTEASNFEDLQEALHVFLGEKQLKPAPLATGWVFTKRNPVLKSGSCKAPSSSMINDATGW